MKTRWVVAVALLTAALSMPAVAAAQQIGGDDVVRDAVAQFLALRHHAEALGWRLPESQGAPDPSEDDHYQGLARYPAPGTPLLYTTQLDTDGGGYLLVARLGSRPTTGERLRSNLQVHGRDTDEVLPPAADSWIRAIRFDQPQPAGPATLPAYKHPGGVQIIDNVLFMALDQPLDGASPFGQLVVFDLAADPETPVLINALPLEHGIDNLGALREPDGRVLLWINGQGGHATRFYRTSTENLRDPGLALELVQVWDPGNPQHFSPGVTPACEGGDWPMDTDAYQGSAFVRQADGQLFMVMTRNTVGIPDFGCDFADLYRLTPLDGGGFHMTRAASLHAFCNQAEQGVSCSFAAAANSYISPSGELILYASPHDDQDSFDPDYVRVAEFRHRDVSTEDSPLRLPGADAGGPYTVDEGASVVLTGTGTPPADRPWVELYDDDGFEDRSIVVDYDDRSLLELEDFGELDDFGDRPSSVRWRAPVGMTIRLWEHDGFDGRLLDLVGTGATEEIADLADVSFSGLTSSLQWIGTPPADPVALEWDLDGNGTFEVAGSTATFSAAVLDGPVAAAATFRVTAANGRQVTDTAAIEVRNVAPAVTIDSVAGGAGGVVLVGVPVTLSGHYTDIAADTHSAQVGWGDGPPSPGTIDPTARTVTAEHTYLTPGQYAAALTVTDDDGGAGTAQAALTVLDAEGAVQDVLDRLDGAIAAATDPAVRDALEDARDALAGHGGTSEDGALDRLEGGQPHAALVKIDQALAAIDEAEAAGGGPYDTEQQVLTLAARAVAEQVYAEAVAAAGPDPSRSRQAHLDAMRAAIDEGAALLAAGDYRPAMAAFRDAVQGA